ncbi:MAG TPA: lipoprotein insertase outer membrane protein LolB [Gammaproteobacteria bacterium]|nr:lipoprotein insertase outer membrane protein LolB [Gammaproteobacteria bacterium]
MSRLRTTALCLPLLLAACAGLRPPPAANAELAWGMHRAALAALESWQLDGRVAVAAGDEGFNGRIGWRQEADAIDMRLQGPFGVGGARLSGNAAALLIETDDGRRYYTDDPVVELADHLRWPLPIDRLRFWVRGIPEPGQPYEHALDSHGRLRWLEQDGWRVTYDGYQTSGALALPRRVTFERETLRVRIVIERWRLTQDADR